LCGCNIDTCVFKFLIQKHGICATDAVGE